MKVVVAKASEPCRPLLPMMARSLLLFGAINIFVPQSQYFDQNGGKEL